MLLPDWWGRQTIPLPSMGPFLKLQPWSLTCNLTMMVSKRNIILFFRYWFSGSMLNLSGVYLEVYQMIVFSWNQPHNLQLRTRSFKIEKQLAQGNHTLPFDELVACNIGNPQAGVKFLWFGDSFCRPNVLFYVFLFNVSYRWHSSPL